MGFSGPVGLKIKVFADNSVRGIQGAVTGANKKDTHFMNVDEARDFKVTEWVDARVITSIDPCPKCGAEIELKHAIEIGHTFKLGSKYSEPLGATFLDEKGKEKPVIMGCYGIGVNRILASLIENSHDKDGIIWPVALSPCEVIVIPLKMDEDAITTEAERVYKELTEAGIDVIIDDREKSPGVKFKDSDLVGFPLQIILGKKSLEQGKLEIKLRKSKESQLVDKDSFLSTVKELLNSGK